MRVALLSLLLLVFFSPSSLFAADDGGGMGIQPMFFSLNIEDPNGDVDSTAGLYPLSAFYAIASSRDYRYLFDASYVSGEVDAGVKQVGQEFSATFFSGGMQKRFRLGRSWKPWVGASITYVSATYEKRHDIDSDGFLVAQYPDREETGFGLTITASSYWSLNDSFDLGFHALIDVPVNIDIQRAGIGVSLLF
jgi:hypothetical protein